MEDNNDGIGMSHFPGKPNPRFLRRVLRGRANIPGLSWAGGVLMAIGGAIDWAYD